LGAYVNEWFIGATQEDLSGYWKLIAITHTCSVIPMLASQYLFPSSQEIEKLQQSM
jgi:hypothetical protein